MKRFITIITCVCLSAITLQGMSGNKAKDGSRAKKMQSWLSERKFQGLNRAAHDPSIYPFQAKALSRIPVKSTEILKQRLDSILHLTQEPFKSTLALINDSKVYFYYSADQLESEEILYGWNIDSAAWYYDQKTTFTYNSSGIVTSYTDYTYDNVLNQWRPDYKYEYSYDTNGNMTLETDSYYDTLTLSWVPDYKYEITYDANNLMLSSQESSYNSDSLAWYNQYKFEFEYTAQGSVQKETEFTWDESLLQWVNTYKHEYTYNTSSELVARVDFIWNVTGASWDQNYKTEYTYDANDLLAWEMTYNYDSLQWNYSNKKEYVYDTLDNNIQTDFYYWDSWDSLWVYYNRDLVDYNVTYTFSDLILPETWWWFGVEANFMVNFKSSENNLTGFWTAENKDIYYYNAVNITGIDPVIKADVLIYPNPARSDLFIRPGNENILLRIELYDISGQAVLQQNFTGGSSISLERLNPGFYIYRVLSQGKQIATGKICKL